MATWGYKKKTAGQQAFEKEIRNLKRRIKTAEDNNYIVPEEVKELTKIKYKDITPQKAVHIRKQAATYKGDMLRRKLITPKGEISFSQIKGYKEQERLNKKYAELDRLQLTKISKEYEKEANKVGKDFVSLAKRKDTISPEDYETIKAGLRKNQETYWGAANFFKGAQHSFSDGYMNESKIRFANVLNFMKNLNPRQIGDIIKWMDTEELELLNAIYNSDDIYEENDGIMARDIVKLEKFLQMRYGYKPLSNQQIKNLANISVKRWEFEHGPIIAYNASVMKRQMENHTL